MLPFGPWRADPVALERRHRGPPWTNRTLPSVRRDVRTVGRANHDPHSAGNRTRGPGHAAHAGGPSQRAADARSGGDDLRRPGPHLGGVPRPRRPPRRRRCAPSASARATGSRILVAQLRPLPRVPARACVGGRRRQPGQHPLEPGGDRVLAGRLGRDGPARRRHVRPGRARGPAQAAPALAHGRPLRRRATSPTAWSPTRTSSRARAGRRTHAAAATTLAGVFYTGGTTGFPKGVMLSHAQLLTSALGTAATGAFVAPSGRLLHAAPMFHLADLRRVGGTNLAGRHARDPPDVHAGRRWPTRSRSTESPTSLLVPTMIQMLVDAPEVAEADLSQPAARSSTARRRSPRPLLERAGSALPAAEFTQAYGMTELAPVATLLSAEDHAVDRPAALGRPRRAARRGADRRRGRQRGPARHGRRDRRAAAPHVMLGYWNQPEETATALRGGWMHTGDGGYMDDEGYVFIVDRIKDMIVSGGENVYSAEVENAARHAPRGGGLRGDRRARRRVGRAGARRRRARPRARPRPPTSCASTSRSDRRLQGAAQRRVRRRAADVRRRQDPQARAARRHWEAPIAGSADAPPLQPRETPRAGPASERGVQRLSKST